MPVKMLEFWSSDLNELSSLTLISEHGPSFAGMQDDHAPWTDE